MIVLFVSSASAQTYDLPIHRWPSNWTVNAAVRVSYYQWYFGTVDTVIPVYLGQSFNLQTKNRTFSVAFDSVYGGGQARWVKLHFRYAVDSLPVWHDHWRECWGDPVPSNGGLWWPDSQCCIYRPSPDTLEHYLRWMAPEGYEHSGYVPIRDDSSTTQITLWKVIGDPTLYYGKTQRALLHVHRLGVWPDSVTRYMDTIP